MVEFVSMSEKATSGGYSLLLSKRLCSLLALCLAAFILLGNGVAASAAADTDKLLIRADSSTDSSQINPIGVTFNYSLGWVDVTTSTFGVTLTPVKQSAYVEGTPWSLLVRYDQSAHANITKITPGWGLGIYDYASWVLLPSSSPFNDMHFTVHSDGQMNLEDTVDKLAVPDAFMIIGDTSPKPSSKVYNLYQNHDYYIENVNLAQLPKAVFGAWESLSDTNAESINVGQGHESASLGEHAGSVLPSNAEFDVIKDGEDDAISSSATGSENDATPTATSSTANEEDATVSQREMETILPPVKYIPGDPDYDPNMDPLGTLYAAPMIGPILVNIVLFIGLAVHAAATFRRYQYRRVYKMSLLQANAGNMPHA